jgi:guanylate kinase
LRHELPDLAYSVSLTTRQPRKGETNGVEYLFVSPGEFQRHLEDNDFLEWAQVYGYYYGSLRQPVEQALRAGKHVLMELDVQGALQVKKALPQAVLIFIMPPSLEELDSRITKRAKDSRQTIERRMQAAPQELQAAKLYDHIIVNDQRERAYSELLRIVRREQGL